MRPASLAVKETVSFKAKAGNVAIMLWSHSQASNPMHAILQLDRFFTENSGTPL